jgi:hypothetical protein
VLGLGFMGNQTRLVLIFFFPKSKFGNHHIFIIYHDISKTLDVLVHLLYKLSIPHKDRTFLHTPGYTRIVMWSPPPHFFAVLFYTQILITFLF